MSLRFEARQKSIHAVIVINKKEEEKFSYTSKGGGKGVFTPLSNFTLHFTPLKFLRFTLDYPFQIPKTSQIKKLGRPNTLIKQGGTG